MRAGFFILLFANLAFFGWAHWVDAPHQAPASDAIARLPRLNLAGELAPAAPATTPPPAPTPGAPMPGNAAAADKTVPTKTALLQAMQSTPQKLPTEIPAEATRCVSIGPFNDIAVAAKAAGDLRNRGFTPVQRAEQGETWDGFWVYIGAVADAASADLVFKTLDRNGIKDAHLMPDGAQGRRISVGLFSERDRAERRVKALQKMGLKAEVADRKQPGTQYWVDLALRPSDGSIPVQDLLAAGAGSGRLSVQSCPKSAANPPAAAALAATPRPASEPASPGLRAPSATVAGAPKLP